MTCRCIACQSGLSVACKDTEARIVSDYKKFLRERISAEVGEKNLPDLLVALRRVQADDETRRRFFLALHTLVSVLSEDQ